MGSATLLNSTNPTTSSLYVPSRRWMVAGKGGVGGCGDHMCRPCAPLTTHSSTSCNAHYSTRRSDALPFAGMGDSWCAIS
eukprot:scaffold241956_cov29-Tisochrysis_lutea.AAC.7